MRFMIGLVWALSLLPIGNVFGAEKKSAQMEQAAIQEEWNEIQKRYPNFAASYTKSQETYRYAGGFSFLGREYYCKLCSARFIEPRVIVTINWAALQLDGRYNHCMREATVCEGAGGGFPGPNQVFAPQDCELEGRRLKKCLGDIEPEEPNPCRKICGR